MLPPILLTALFSPQIPVGNTRRFGLPEGAPPPAAPPEQARPPASDIQFFNGRQERERDGERDRDEYRRDEGRESRRDDHDRRRDETRRDDRDDRDRYERGREREPRRERRWDDDRGAEQDRGRDEKPEIPPPPPADGEFSLCSALLLSLISIG